MQQAARQMQLLALLVGCWLCLSVAAADGAVTARDRHFFFGHDGHKRSLLQDALSNSNGCLPTIPKCEAGACATRNIMGVARWVCLRCSGNYEPVVDASGQDNIIQCVCPRGTYEDAPGAVTCTKCPANSYCPGGPKVENPTTRGDLVGCGPSLITRNTGARSQTDCVAPAGYAMSSVNGATPCTNSTYAPIYNRLVKCLRCQSGLEENPAANLGDGQRDNRKTVCKVPPGKYMSQGLVRTCPQGFYRENYVDYDNATAQICLPCNPGITTAGAASKLAADCNVVIAGYGIDRVLNVTGPQSIPALPQSASGLPNATLCDIGFYSSGGFCAQCPLGTLTRNKGSKAIEECVVPPGYVIKAGNMTQCVSGEFREGWVMYSDPKGAACTPCGANISSEARDLDESPLATSGALVRATSASCFIVAGQGMIAQGKNAFSAMDCPVNTYGAAGNVYGWAAAPCKPCPRNMITDGATRVNNSDVCINPAGFGYATEGASRCAPGFYAAKGSRKACKRCPDGRTTFDDPTKQQYASDCMVAPGNGVVVNLNGALPGFSDIFAANVTNLSEQQILGMTVLQCPTGYYGGGNTLGATCTKCPDSSTTTDPGATDVSQCNVCRPGYGKDTPDAKCTLCKYGTWQPGGFATCIACDNTVFYPPVDGKGPTWNASGTTFDKGTVAAEWCVPMQSQLSPEAGQAFFGPSLMNLSFLSINRDIANLSACFLKCAEDQCCFAQLNMDSGDCAVATLPPANASDGGLQLYYKLPLSGLSSASSVKGAAGGSAKPAGAAAPSRIGRARASASRARFGGRARPSGAGAGGVSAASSSSGGVQAKTLASGSYATCGVPSINAKEWKSVGTALGADARTFSTVPDAWFSATNVYKCTELCDNSNVCWGFIYDGVAGKCLFRGGEDALRTRSFFQLPQPGSATGFTPSAYYAFALSYPGATTADITGGVLDAFIPSIAAAVRSVLPAQDAGSLDDKNGWIQANQDYSYSPTDVNVVDPDVVLLVFSFDPSQAAALQRNSALLDAVFGTDQPSITAAVARQLFVGATSSGETLFYGRNITLAGTSYDTNTAHATLGTAIPMDGCQLVSNYCNGKSSACAASVCTQCVTGSGYTCT